MSAYHNFLIMRHDIKLTDREILQEKPKNFSSCADYCREFFANYDKKSKVSERDAIEQYVLSQGVEMPKSKYGWIPEKMRLESYKWWEKKIRIKKIRLDEALKIKGGFVRKYCSDELLEKAREQRERMRHWLENTYIYDNIAYKAAQENETKARLNSKNDCGHIVLTEKQQKEIDRDYAKVNQLTLKQVSDSSLSNVNLRVHELNVRCKGLTEYYEKLNYRAIMVTVTSPSENHRLKTLVDSKGNKTKELNKNYKGATPKEVQNNFFNKQFALVRTALSNRGINVLGVRVAEPHQDACVHWHLVLWFKNGIEAKHAIKAFRKYFLFHNGEPSKAQLKHALKFDTVNPKKGDAVGYLLAYINKGITGEHIDSHTDQNGEKITNGKDGAERTQIWARCWGIRQYQFLGNPPICTYREFRRVWCKEIGRGKKNQVTVPTLEQHQALQEFYKNNPMTEEFKELWYAANEGNYGRYIKGFYDVQGQKEIDNSSNFLIMSCAIYAHFSKSFGKKILEQYAQKVIKPAPKLLTHGFKDDLKLLCEQYEKMITVPTLEQHQALKNGDKLALVPDDDIYKLESLNAYYEPKCLVYGVTLGGENKLITRKFNGYFEKFWALKTKEKPETDASEQEKIESYAVVRAADGIDQNYWGDVVNFAFSRTCGNNYTGKHKTPGFLQDIEPR